MVMPVPIPVSVPPLQPWTPVQRSTDSPLTAFPPPVLPCSLPAPATSPQVSSLSDLATVSLDPATSQRVLPNTASNPILPAPASEPLPHASNKRSSRARRPPPRYAAAVTTGVVGVSPVSSLRAAAASMSDAFAVDAHNKPLTYKTARKSPDSALWRLEESKELIRLIDGTHTMAFIDWSMKPPDRQASYYNPQVQCKVKDGIIVRRIRGTYGGNISDFSGNCSSYTADLQTVKLHYNAIVSEGARMLTLDLTDFYLGSILPHPEYMWLTRDQIPPDIQDRYMDTICWRGDRALVRIDNGIYGLPQAGKLAQDDLIPLLESGGYYQCRNTPLL